MATIKNRLNGCKNWNWAEKFSKIFKFYVSKVATALLEKIWWVFGHLYLVKLFPKVCFHNLMVLCGKGLTIVEQVSVKNEYESTYKGGDARLCVTAFIMRRFLSVCFTNFKANQMYTRWPWLFFVQLCNEQNKSPKMPRKMPKNGIFLPFWLVVFEIANF